MYFESFAKSRDHIEFKKAKQNFYGKALTAALELDIIKAWDESEHPRDDDGKFSNVGGEKGQAANSDLTSSEGQDSIDAREMRRKFVDHDAPCVTTLKKFTGYFLKEGAKHAENFFRVGYTANDPLQLRYDIAKQFDMSKAVNFAIKSGGEETFNIYMTLGVTKKRTFLTGWRRDRANEKPRIVTAFRKEPRK